MPTILTPYISFQNNAREAMEFYQTVFGGTLDISTFADLHAAVEPDENDLVMHSQLTAENGMVFMASDTPHRMQYTPGDNFSVSLSGDDEAELTHFWNKLAAKGTVLQKLEKAPWGDSFGMCLDKFGIRWLVNIAGPKAAE